MGIWLSGPARGKKAKCIIRTIKSHNFSRLAQTYVCTWSVELVRDTIVSAISYRDIWAGRIVIHSYHWLPEYNACRAPEICPDYRLS